jgi:hypothetical protein
MTYAGLPETNALWPEDLFSPAVTLNLSVGADIGGGQQSGPPK